MRMSPDAGRIIAASSTWCACACLHSSLEPARLDLLASALAERALDVAWYAHVAACMCAVLLGGDTQRGASWQLALMII